MVPAQQRLGADKLSGDQAELRLVDHDELAALNGFGESLLRVDLALVLGRKLVVEQAMLPTAKRLGAVHGNVRGAHQRLDRAAMIRADRNADGRADIDAVAVELERLRDGDGDAPPDPLDVRRRLDLGKEQGELVAGQARE